eukprot:4135666-Prymnesium_polylepis.1
MFGALQRHELDHLASALTEVRAARPPPCACLVSPDHPPPCACLVCGLIVPFCVHATLSIRCVPWARVGVP